MSRYLYGANINEIQPLIFETGKLKEIIGASVFVERACREMFMEIVGEQNYSSDNQVITAAGKIQYIFDDKARCQSVIKHYFRELSEKMPGVNLCQAVVEIDNKLRPADITELERRLAAQRNTPSHQHQLALMISERSRRTGSPAVRKRKDGTETDFVDQKQDTKQGLSKEKSQLFAPYLKDTKGFEHLFPKEIDEIRQGKDKEWIAVVHADGNNLGKLIQDISQEVEQKAPEQYQVLTASFSDLLDQATKRAARDAYQCVVEPLFESGEKPSAIPLSPVLLGGDDLTLIIRADLAVDFVDEFLIKFELYTKQAFSKLSAKYKLVTIPDGLTACAGIAYIKYNYPFHFGVTLANDLCEYAKNRSKSIPSQPKQQPPSCLAFHKVQSSYIGNFEKDIMERELKTTGKDDELQFNYGPYFISPVEGYAEVNDLKKWLHSAQQDGAPVSGLREWLTALHENPAYAQQLMKRIERLNYGLGLQQPWLERTYQKPGTEELLNEKVTHIYDVLTLANL